ncbi:MAG: transglutaminase family protein [Bacteroidales bacterium]
MRNASILSITEILRDSDNDTFNMIVAQLKSDKSPDTIKTLKTMWFDTKDLKLKHKLEKLITPLQYGEIEAEIQAWKNKENKNLLELLLSINKVEYRFDDQSYIRENFERLKQDIWLEINDNLTSLEKFNVMNYILFKEYGFIVDHARGSIMSNYISTVLEYRRSNILLFSILYTTLARSLGITISFINYIDYPLLAYIDVNVAREIYSDTNDYSPIIFYIDLTNQGKVLTRSQVDENLNSRFIRNSHKYKDRCSDTSIIKRHLENIGHIYKERKQTDKLENIANIYKLLKS